jgi:hypothetical protein
VASSLTTVRNGYALTSILNTNVRNGYALTSILNTNVRNGYALTSILNTNVRNGYALTSILNTNVRNGYALTSILNTNVRNGYALTSILNTNEHEVTIPKPKLKLEQAENSSIVATEEATNGTRDCREEILNKLRLEHRNDEERNTLQNTCLNYQDIFYLPGDKLSSKNAVKHSITLVPGTVPINTRPYRLPEAQRAEMEEQVTKLLNEGIIEESSSSWNSTLFIVPKKIELQKSYNCVKYTLSLF